MKKLILGVSLLLGGMTSQAQTEFIEVSNNKLFNKSFAAYYNDSNSSLEDDLEVTELGRNETVHIVYYTNVSKVVIIGSDTKNSVRDIEVNGKRMTIDSHLSIYNFKLSGVEDSVKIFKPYEL